MSEYETLSNVSFLWAKESKLKSLDGDKEKLCRKILSVWPPIRSCSKLMMMTGAKKKKERKRNIKKIK
jgi:hypothetical protein